MNSDYMRDNMRDRDGYKRMGQCERSGLCSSNNMENYCDDKQGDSKYKKTKESGFINVTDPTLRNDIKRATKCRETARHDLQLAAHLENHLVL